MRNNIFYSGKKEFNVLDAGVGEFVYLVVQYLIIALLYMAISLGLPKGGVLNSVASLLVELGFVGTVFIVAASSKTNAIGATKLNKKPNGYQLGFCVLIALIAYFGFASLTNSFIDLLDLIGYKSSSSGINVNSWWKYLLYTITMAAVPAFCEELLFRGVIYQGLRKWSKVGAVFVSAALFMLMHGSPDQTVHQFILGVVLAIVFGATGSIWCPMLIHFLNNFIALTLSFVVSLIQQNAGGASASATSEATSLNPVAIWFVQLASAAVSAVVAGLLIWVIVKYLHKKNSENGAERQLASTEPEAVEATKENDASEKGKKFALVFFVLASVWVCFEWIQTLVTGLLK